MSQSEEPINNTPVPDQQVEVQTDTQPVSPSTAEPASILDDLISAAAEEPVAAKAKEPEVTAEGAERVNIQQNTHIELEPFKEGVNKSRPEVLATPAAPMDETMRRLTSITADEVKGKPHYADWVNTIQQGIARLSFNGASDEIFARPSAKWVQRLKYGNATIGQSGSTVNFAEGEILTGEQAINAAKRHVGIGGNFTTVLPHSGFWMTIRPPMEESVLELYRQINNIKTEVGRRTYGLLLGSESGLVNELFVRFALSSMVRNSIKDVDNILAMMSIHDINILIWGYICTMYPNGFNHTAACIADTTKCQHIVEDIISVRRLFFMDKNVFSEKQLAHLSSSSASSMSVEKVNEYREEMRAREKHTIRLNEGEEEEVQLELRVPSALEYFQSTHRWIDSIGDKVVEALGADSTFSARNLMINEHASSTQMRKYAHWVDRIYINGGIVDRKQSGAESIEKVLDSWSSSATMREEFDEKVQEYVKSTCVALIGIPDFKCPKCGEYQISEKEVNPLHRSIVGLDVAMTFFTVLVQRIQLATGMQV